MRASISFFFQLMLCWADDQQFHGIRLGCDLYIVCKVGDIIYHMEKYKNFPVVGWVPSEFSQKIPELRSRQVTPYTMWRNTKTSSLWDGCQGNSHKRFQSCVQGV